MVLTFVRVAPYTHCTKLVTVSLHFFFGSVTRTTQANALTQHVTPSTLTVVKDLVKMISYIAFRLLELAGQTSPVVKRLPLLMTTIQPAQSILRIVRSAVVGFTENFAKNFTFKMPIHAGQLQLLVSALSVLLPYQNSISVAWFSQSLKK